MDLGYYQNERLILKDERKETLSTGKISKFILGWSQKSMFEFIEVTISKNLFFFFELYKH